MKKRIGFGLIEVMAALTIITIVIGAAAAITSRSISVTGRSEDKVAAAGVAQSGVEFARSFYSNKGLDEQKNSYSINNINFEAYLKVEDKNNEDTFGGMLATSWVIWTDRVTHKSQTYTLETILTNWQQ